MKSKKTQPRRFDHAQANAHARAEVILSKMTAAQKLDYVQGHNSFFIRGFPELGIPELYLADSTQGVHIRTDLPNPMTHSTAFPCALALASTWNPTLAGNYARSVGEECRAGGVAILLGPGMNIYRHSQCGRNFEYLGEDPFLVSRMVESYVSGMLETGVVPTLKHFVANNSDWHRRTSNSIIDDRTLHEIYLPAFQAGIDAGAPAVMTSYNLLNGEWTGQSHRVITKLLREEMGFDGLVMTDWWSVYDAKKIITSGQDLEMPGNGTDCIARDGVNLLESGSVAEADLDRMVRSLLRTTIAAGLFDRPLRDERYYETFPAHVEVALETARQGIVLLKNDGTLPLSVSAQGIILLTGTYAETEAYGGGAAEVAGYDFVSLRAALEAQFGDRLCYRAFPTDDELSAADWVIQSIGTHDREGQDRSFDLPPSEEAKARRAVSLNRRTIVVVNTGGGVNLSAWNDKAAAILFGWYPGQIGNQAMAEIIAGHVNPSGRLPFTIEKRFEDSPGYGYLPKNAQLYSDGETNFEHEFPIHDLRYTEGIFVGYRWYDTKGFTPLYAFGHGLSYSRFEYTEFDLESSIDETGEPRVTVCLTIENHSLRRGAEVVQFYVRDPEATVPRPVRELKAFRRVELEKGASQTIKIVLDARSFSFWDCSQQRWKWEPGRFMVEAGSASDNIRCRAEIVI